jgi:hypothetical protein
LVSGQGDWDSGISANFNVLDRGYHITQRAGTAIGTGQILWLNSGGFFFPFDPASTTINPVAYAYLAAASGDSMTALAWGAVRSLDINSGVLAGDLAYSSSAGYAVSSYAGCDRPIGFGLTTGGLLFMPRGSSAAAGGTGVTMLSSLSDVAITSVTSGQHLVWSGSSWQNTAPFPALLTSSVAINAVVGSTHVFTMSAGIWGWGRQTVMKGSSADLVSLKFYGESTLTTRLYETRSGGVSVVGSYQDRAPWPFENTDVATGATIYGALQIMSGALVGSDTISVQMQWERDR